MLSQPDNQRDSYSSRGQTDLADPLICLTRHLSCLSNSTHPSSAEHDSPCSENPGETCCLQVWGLEARVAALSFGCLSSDTVLLSFCAVLFHCPFVSQWDPCFIYLVSPLWLNAGPTDRSHLSIFANENWGKWHILHHFFSGQSLSSAAELEKVKITTLGNCVVYLIHFFTLGSVIESMKYVRVILHLSLSSQFHSLPSCVLGAWPQWIAWAGSFTLSAGFYWVWPVGDTSSRSKNRRKDELEYKYFWVHWAPGALLPPCALPHFGVVRASCWC